MKMPVFEGTRIYHSDSLIIVTNRTLTTVSIATNFIQFYSIYLNNVFFHFSESRAFVDCNPLEL